MVKVKRMLSFLMALAFILIPLSTSSLFSLKSMAAGKTHIKSIDHDSNSGTVIIEGGYKPSDRYVVLSGRVKALNPVDHSGWINSVALCLSGAANNGWENYAFQFAYGTNENENLIKLNDGKTGEFDGIGVNQEQWYNNKKMEKLFDESGIDFKLIRMNNWAYLLADLGDGYELIGRMGLPDDAPTELSLDNTNTPVRLSRITVETGEKPVLAALQGFDLRSANWGKTDLSYDAYYFPVNSTSWRFEAKITTPDFEAHRGGDRRYTMLGVKGGGATLAIFKNLNENWYVQDTGEWSSDIIRSDVAKMFNPAAGGLYTRWIRNGTYMTIWFSIDGETWEIGHKVDNLDPAASGIYLNGEWMTVLEDIKITLSADTPSDIFLADQTKKEEDRPYTRTPIFPGSIEGEKWAVMTAHVQSDSPIQYGQWKNNFLPSLSGYAADQSPFAFQIIYGNDSNHNLVKLMDGKDGQISQNDYGDSWWILDASTIEQWYNNPKLEKMHSSEGMNIRLVRMGYIAYLLVDMGDGWELLGKMKINPNAPTQFSLLALETEIRASNITVETGKEAAAKALDGLPLFIASGTTRSFEFEDRQWVVDTQIKLPENPQHSMLSVMLPLYDRAARFKWNGSRWAVGFDGYNGSNTTPVPEAALPDPDGNGKIWVRWVRDNSNFYIYAGTDGISYTLCGSVDKFDNVLSNDIIDPIIFRTWEMGTNITNLKIRTGAQAIENLDKKAIAVTTQPAKTEYVEGESFNPDGTVITLTKQDDSKVVVPINACTFNASEKLATLDTEVLVSYNGLTAVIPIKVSEKSAKTVAFKDLPYRSEYKLNEPFNATGASYIVTYDNGDVAEFDITTAMCKAVDTAKNGVVEVSATVPFQDGTKELTFKIKVGEVGEGTDPTDPVNPTEPLPHTGETILYTALSVLVLSLSAILLINLLKKKQS